MNRSNHQDLLVELYHSDGPVLLAYARAVTGHVQDAEDALQTALVNLMRHEGVGIANLRAYVYKAIRNAARNGIRSRVRRLRREETAETGPVALFQEPAERQEALDTLNAAMDDLPPEQREVVVMKVWGRLSFAEIAGIVGVPRDTAASRYRYAIDSLRSKMEVFFDAGSP